jgi:hypothetical protein
LHQDPRDENCKPATNNLRDESADQQQKNNKRDENCKPATNHLRAENCRPARNKQ